MSTTKTTRLRVLSAAGVILVMLLLFYYCGPVSRDSQPVAQQSSPVIESVPVPEEGVESVSVEPFAAEPAEPRVAPVPVAVVEPEPVVPEPIRVAAAPPPPAPEETAPRFEEPPPKVGAPPFAPVPDQDLLIADAAFRRFKPDVAAMALENLAVGTPIQSDGNSLSVLEPCDTAASGCAAGLAPGRGTGTANDWTGFVLPGFLAP